MNRFDEATHTYTIDGVVVPSLTQMLDMDGQNEHLRNAPPEVVKAKAEWGTKLHHSLLCFEHGYDEHAFEGFESYRDPWLNLCKRMKWLNPLPIWKKAEMPVYVSRDGFQWAFTPDRAAPEAVVEIKGTYSEHPCHDIQTALQVIGMGYPRTTPRFVAYFDKKGFKLLHTCDNEADYNEADRIIFEHARAI